MTTNLDMDKIVVAILEQKGGLAVVVAFGLIAVALVGYVIFFFAKIVANKIKNMKKGPGNTEFVTEDETILAKRDGDRFVISKNGLETLKELFDHAYEKYNETTTSVSRKTQETYDDQIDKCMKEVASNIQLGYMKFLTEEDIDKQDDIIMLLVESAFCSGMKLQLQELDKVKDEVLSWNETDMTDRMNEIVKSCERKISLEIHKFKGINKDALNRGMQDTNMLVRDAVITTIKRLVKLTKIERDELEKALDERVRTLDEKLNRMFNVQD